MRTAKQINEDFDIISIQDVILDNNLEDTEIGRELLDDGELYLTAEEFGNEFLAEITKFMKDLLLAELDEISAGVDVFFDKFEAKLQEICNNAENNDAYSDDSLEYMINSLDMPNKFREICELLQGPEAHKLIIRLDNSEVCEKAQELLNKLLQEYSK